MAALALLSPAEPELSLPTHQLDVASSPLLSDSHVVPEEAAEPLMMAQQVPHQTTDKKRVKVYELRHNDWFDRGTGFCYACFVPVRLAPHPCRAFSQPLRLFLDAAPPLLLFFFSRG